MVHRSMGLGGAIKSIAGSSQDAIDTTLQMYGIAQAESDWFGVPALDGRGAAMGFDILKIVGKNTRPAVNTGLAQRHMNRPGAGVGHLHPPMEAFIDAVIAFAEVEA